MRLGMNQSLACLSIHGVDSSCASSFHAARSATMPSLHLDIPSIDWIERAPRRDSHGGKARPAREESAPAPVGGLASPAAAPEARDSQPSPGGLAGAKA
jgi:hypothetical protein